MINDILAKAEVDWDQIVSVVSVSVYGHGVRRCVRRQGAVLSGAGQPEAQSNLRHELDLIEVDTKKVSIGEDLLGPVPSGGVVIISGTGSNCVVYNEDGTKKRAGGYETTQLSDAHT